MSRDIRASERTLKHVIITKKKMIKVSHALPPTSTHKAIGIQIEKKLEIARNQNNLFMYPFRDNNEYAHNLGAKSHQTRQQFKNPHLVLIN